MIRFNVPPCTGMELDCIRQAIESGKICGDGVFTGLCSRWMEERLHATKVLMTTSGTAALEMAARLCGLQSGDEVILPSYTFPSTANALVLAGARLVFVDIRPDTMNIDEKLVEQAITSRTRAICVVHYAGVACEMDAIMGIARQYHLKVIEDAAQAMMCTYRGKPLGAIGDYGCFSFHETKNYSMGEGGALVLRNANDVMRAEIIREKGTNRSQFLRGEIAKYFWVDIGSSYLPSEINAAYLWPQLQQAEDINRARLGAWERYHEAFRSLENEGVVTLPRVPDGCVHNAHTYYIKCPDHETRQAYIAHMQNHGIACLFHYIPLHSTPAGLRYGTFSGEDTYTTAESERLVRLPLYYGLTPEDQNTVIHCTKSFFRQNVSCRKRA